MSWLFNTTQPLRAEGTGGRESGHLELDFWLAEQYDLNTRQKLPTHAILSLILPLV